LRIRSLPYDVVYFNPWWTAGHKFIISQARHNWWICSLTWQGGCMEVLRPGKNILAKQIWRNFLWILLSKTSHSGVLYISERWRGPQTSRSLG